MHDRTFDCGKKPKPKPQAYKYRKRAIREEERGRYTERWKHKSIAVREDAHYLCEVCFDNGEIVTGGLSVHHIAPLLEGGELCDDLNLVCLCEKCHRMAERGAISREKLRELAKKRLEASPRGV